MHVQLPPKEAVAGKADQEGACEKERQEKGEKEAQEASEQKENQKSPSPLASGKAFYNRFK
jgi:hypothetical protein